MKAIIDWTAKAEELIGVCNDENIDKIIKKNNKKFENMNLDKLESVHKQISGLFNELEPENFDQMNANVDEPMEEVKEESKIKDATIIEENKYDMDNDMMMDDAENSAGTHTIDLDALKSSKPIGIDDLLNEKGELKHETIPTPKDKELDKKLDIIMKDLRGKTRRKATAFKEDPEEVKVPPRAPKRPQKPKYLQGSTIFPKFAHWLKFDKVRELRSQIDNLKSTDSHHEWLSECNKIITAHTNGEPYALPNTESPVDSLTITVNDEINKISECVMQKAQVKDTAPQSSVLLCHYTTVKSLQLIVQKLILLKKVLKHSQSSTELCLKAAKAKSLSKELDKLSSSTKTQADFLLL